MEFFERETCGRCSTCRIGTGVLRRLFSDMARGRSQGPDSFLELNGIAVALWTGSLCGLGRGVPSRLQSILRYWQPTLAHHVEGKGCQICDE
jgi:NADH-quinone oxidoreductase subunit F